jgi:hypothetical protein
MQVPRTLLLTLCCIPAYMLHQDEMHVLQITTLVGFMILHSSCPTSDGEAQNPSNGQPDAFLHSKAAI